MAVTVKKAQELEFKIYRFGSCTDGSAEMKEILGGKGANLAEMSSIGMPIPSGFTIPCIVSVKYKKIATVAVARAKYLQYVWSQVQIGMKYLENVYGYMPLVSVRSGARVSMPGMMDTILNIGLTSSNLEYWMKKLGDRVVLDSYRRLIQMYSSVVWNVPMEEFEEILENVRLIYGVESDTQIPVNGLQAVLSQYAKLLDSKNLIFPDKMEDQLHGAILAVFDSWDNQRAKDYRMLYGIPDEWGTAVNVQSMVFGNMNENSCTGVVFSRNPSNGENEITGEYLVNAQGEDVVAGIRTPENIGTLAAWSKTIAKNLFNCVEELEQHYKDMQDIEFTVQDRKLYLLQTRSGKRSSQAAFKIVHDMVEEELIEVGDVVKRLTRDQLFSLLQDSIDDANCIFNPNTVGIASGGGVVVGRMMLSADSAINCKDDCILVRKETDPNDLLGMNASVGVLTSTGGLTSHAAVVARGMNKACVVGAVDVNVDELYKVVTVNGVQYQEGCKVTLDGSTGRVWFEEDIPIIRGSMTEEVLKLVKWMVELKGCVERLEMHVGMSGVDLKSAVDRVVGSSLYIDLGMLELRMGVGESFESKVKFLGNALVDSPVSVFVVDISDLADFYEDEDRLYDVLLGTETRPTYQDKVAMLMKWPSAVLDKVFVKSKAENQDLAKVLKKYKLRTVSRVSNVADLVNAEGYYEVTDDVIQKVFGSKEVYVAMKEAIEMKFGKNYSDGSIRELGLPVYWYQLFGR